LDFETTGFKALALSLMPVAQRAGAAILDIYRSAPRVHYKADRSPVTDADRAAEETILEALEKLMPGVPVIAEEEVAAGRIPVIDGVFFLVDPLDGTKEFLRGNGEFTVNIALIDNGRPVFGLIYAPEKHDCYLTLEPGMAVRGTLHPAHAPPKPSEADFSLLTGEAPSGRPITAIVSRSRTRPETQSFLESLRPHQTLAMGSSLKFGVLARGDADVYPRFGQTSEWDIAAGHALLDATGGIIVTADGARLRYGKKESGFINPPFIAWRRPGIWTGANRGDGVRTPPSSQN
jgi:3'(2'), 5'-bisphosphate nucleotidase